MKTLLSMMIAMICVGCFSQARVVQKVEAPDPMIGDLHCSAPRLTVLEALYVDPSVPVPCEAKE